MKYPRIKLDLDLIHAGPDEVHLWSWLGVVKIKDVWGDGVLRKLLPLLDGEHALADIIAESGFDPDDALETLKHLEQRGLLEDSAGVRPKGLSREEVRRYRGQAVAFSQVSGSLKAALEVQERLKKNRVLVYGLGLLGSKILTALAHYGVGRLVAADPTAVGEEDLFRETYLDKHDIGASRAEALTKHLRARNPHVSIVAAVEDLDVASAQETAAFLRDYDTVVLAVDEFNPALYDKVNLACLESGTIWTSCRSNTFELTVGPTVIPGQTACYECYNLRWKANLTYYQEYLILEAQARTRPFLRGGGLPCVAPAADLAALEVIKILTKIGEAPTYGKLFTLNLRSLESRLIRILKVPNCPGCGAPANDQPPQEIWQGWVREETS